MSKGQIYETRPLEIWAKAKALRAKWQDSISNEHGLLAHGNTSSFDWRDGFANFTLIEDNPAGAMIANKSDEFARRARLASERTGWGRELCGYVNNCWGAQFLGYEMDGKPFALRDMCVPFPDPCDQHLMRGQQCMDFSPIPRWGDDYPMYLGPRDVKRDEELIEHKVYCIMRVINDIERIFGVKFNDDRLFEAHQSRSKVRDYGREISLAMTNIPSPLGQKDLYSFYTLGGLTKLGPEETENFWKELRDEVMWRVENKIAAVGNERYRWMEAHPSPWHFLKYYRYMEKYGAVCIGSQYSQMIGGPMELRPDGTFGPREMPPAPNKPVRTREDLIRSSIREARGQHMKADEYMRPYALNEFAVGYKVNGALLPLWRGGVGCTLTRKEQGLRLSEIGVSVLHYEGSQPGDRTDLDERNFLDRLDVWMESQGLRMLED